MVKSSLKHPFKLTTQLPLYVSHVNSNSKAQFTHWPVVEITTQHWPNVCKFMKWCVNLNNAQATVAGLNLNRKKTIQFALLTFRGQQCA